MDWEYLFIYFDYNCFFVLSTILVLVSLVWNSLVWYINLIVDQKLVSSINWLVQMLLQNFCWNALRTSIRILHIFDCVKMIGELYKFTCNKLLKVQFKSISAISNILSCNKVPLVETYRNTFLKTRFWVFINMDLSTNPTFFQLNNIFTGVWYSPLLVKYYNILIKQILRILTTLSPWCYVDHIFTSWENNANNWKTSFNENPFILTNIIKKMK